MKAISRRAGVSQALLHYHFGSKDHLYAEVVRTRSQLINAEREALLEKVDLMASAALEDVLDALFRPPLGPAGGDQAYGRIFGGLIVGSERERALVKECYDPTAKRFVKAIEMALPAASPKTAAMADTFALGGLVALISRDGRLERLGGQQELQETEDLIAALIDFASAGIRGLVRKNR